MKKFFKVENWAVESHIFSTSKEMLVYLILCRFCNNGKIGFPSILTICRVGMMSQTTVVKALRSLESKNIITKSRMGRSSTYSMNKFSPDIDHSSLEVLDSNLANCNTPIQLIYKEQDINKKYKYAESMDLSSLDENETIAKDKTETESINATVEYTQEDYPEHLSEIQEAFPPSHSLIKAVEKKREEINNFLEIREKKVFRELLVLIQVATGEGMIYVEGLVRRHGLTLTQLEDLVKKISESPFLSGKLLNKKPSLKHFSTREQFFKILTSYYKSSEGDKMKSINSIGEQPKPSYLKPFQRKERVKYDIID